MKLNDLMMELNFSETQLQAIVKIYEKYFEPYMTSYDGRSIIAVWRPGAEWTPTKGYDLNHNNLGIVSKECIHDELWNEFSDLLPHMSPNASITKMPAGKFMSPHVDRKLRPEAIYFPISGCSDRCVSEYYDLPKNDTPNSQRIGFFPPAKFTFAITDRAILTNVHEWHGVRNMSNVERVAFGWNMKMEYSFEKCKEILTDLGYAK
jgi:hypothetical protein